VIEIIARRGDLRLSRREKSIRNNRRRCEIVSSRVWRARCRSRFYTVE